ncbi:Protein of unknown function [Pustulibacterium marinum]|uniref:DUF2975 domain-containing protein n=1 Tax=Pustulibacterium marinum TaxID=1224947 RepID=A0A1I7HC05_9FLAO|nr:DUF2975 domain-containing protein [Pustulibacterium marinum]SFU58248.1 Protein of unknown function [Pustulibacterium marinum]
MKTKLFKDVLDVFLIFTSLICFILIIVSPFNALELKVNGDNYKGLEGVPWFTWGVIIMNTIAYMFFFRGILFLRKASRFMNSKNIFKNELESYLKKAGFAILLCGGLLWVASALTWMFFTIFKSTTSLAVSEDTMFVFILIIFGLFLMIQSDFMKRANQLKEENDLTI